MKISTGFLVSLLCASFVHGECQIDSSKCMKNIVVPIFGSLLSAVALLLVIVRILIWKLIRIRKAAVDGEKRNKTPVASKKFQFTYDEVLEITENFQTEIGKGGFGIVYHGYLKDGTQIVVKILSPSSSQGAREFQIEVELLMRIHHRNLTSLIGYYNDTDNLALIYEYMPNANLKEYLSDADRSSHMTWELRIRIALDIALGLHYLRKECNPRVVHRDVKTANILLKRKLGCKNSRFRSVHGFFQ
ncbi:hypothetical protein ACFX15_025893 [Malus domestica]